MYVPPWTESTSCTMVEALLGPKTAVWSTMVMHTRPFDSDILQKVHPHHEVLLSCKPHRPVQAVTNGDLYSHKYMMMLGISSQT